MPVENRSTDASLSTMWAIKDHPDLDDFFHLAKQLGFQKIELNHQVDSAMLSQVNLDHTQFSSIHEPCPADISTKELVNRDWLISSPDETSRKRGVEAIKKSIGLAQKLSAPVVVVHCGNVSTHNSLENKLRKLYEAGQAQSAEYLDLKYQYIQSRFDLAEPRVAAVVRSLNELLDYASQTCVKLGLENRYHYMDIPSLDEMDVLLGLAGADELGFIYDVGHAQALDCLGFYSHLDWLNRFSGRMFGAHLHDVQGVSDHLSPGLGEIDFKMIASYLPDGAFRTLEL